MTASPEGAVEGIKFSPGRRVAWLNDVTHEPEVHGTVDVIKPGRPTSSSPETECVFIDWDDGEYGWFALDDLPSNLVLELRHDDKVDFGDIGDAPPFTRESRTARWITNLLQEEDELSPVKLVVTHGMLASPIGTDLEKRDKALYDYFKSGHDTDPFRKEGDTEGPSSPLLFQHPGGDYDSIKWPDYDPTHLAGALYDAREQGLIPDVSSVILPDGTTFDIDANLRESDAMAPEHDEHDDEIDDSHSNPQKDDEHNDETNDEEDDQILDKDDEY